MPRRYFFADESGNFDFRVAQGASRYFAVGTVSVQGDQDRATIDAALSQIRYDLINQGYSIDGGFHATTDRQAVRDRVYDKLLDLPLQADITVLDKRKAQPKLRASDETFYQYAWWFHFNSVRWNLRTGDELVLVAATLGTKKKKATFHDAIQKVVDQKCPPQVNKKVVSMRDDCDNCLQVADYMLWAIMRDIERSDNRSRDIIKTKVRTVWQPFSKGQKLYY